MAALIVAFAEIWLYVSQAKRVERAREAVERLGEGDKAEPKLVVEAANEDEDEDEIVKAFEQADETYGVEQVATTEEIVLAQSKGTTQTSREVSNVRLRRRPVAGQEE